MSTQTHQSIASPLPHLQRVNRYLYHTKIINFVNKNHIKKLIQTARHQAIKKLSGIYHFRIQ